MDKRLMRNAGLTESNSGKVGFYHVKETGLIAVEQGGRTVELTLDDINGINKFVKKIGTNKIARTKDFNESISEIKKSKSAKKVLQLMDKYEDGDSRYMEFVKKVSKEDGIPVKQLEKELNHWI